MRTPDPDLRRYRELLEEDVFFTSRKWPQFHLLLDSVEEVAGATPAGATVLSFERNLLYGGISLFAPFFRHCDFFVAESSPQSNASRGGYNEHLLSRCTAEFGGAFFASARLIPDADFEGAADVILVPNLLHHVPDLRSFFASLSSHLKKTGQGFIFDSTLREWHQCPDDYYRLTPYAVSLELQRSGLREVRTQSTGGPFSAILYCWHQALEYLTPDESLHEEWVDWLTNVHQPILLELEERFPTNPVRPSSTFPTAYAVWFERA